MNEVERLRAEWEAREKEALAVLEAEKAIYIGRIAYAAGRARQQSHLDATFLQDFENLIDEKLSLAANKIMVSAHKIDRAAARIAAAVEKLNQTPKKTAPKTKRGRS